MKYKRYYLQLGNGIGEFIGNLWYGNECSIAEIEDAILDARNGEELAQMLNGLNLLRKFELSRETEDFVRLKGVDCNNNISYFKVQL